MITPTKLRRGTLIYHHDWGMRQVKEVKEIQRYVTEPRYFAVFTIGHTELRADDPRWSDAVIIQTLSELKA
jgi:hypothetical protein